MQLSSPPLALISAKLNRPQVALDAVSRERLRARLDEGFHLPLTLVSAPAGYGKTTLVGQWLDARTEPCAWVSLDETDNDPRRFLGYVTAAVRSAFPDACPETLTLLKASELPAPQVVVGVLVNDLDAIEGDWVLALDDYDRIREPAIHRMMGGVLKHPPRGLHLVIASRRDPTLPLGSLRGRDLMGEVRLNDLQFTREESGEFLRRATHRALGERVVDLLHARTEGWPVGLRLAALALRQCEDVDAFVRNFGSSSAHVQGYLVDEILSQQRPSVADCLRRTAILNRFCAALVDAVCDRQARGAEPPVGGRELIRLLDDQGMPCVALDDQRQWFRYHHLFRDLLLGRLHDRMEAAEIASLHRRAAAWFEANDLLEEALEHALKAGDATEAGRLIARHGREIKDGEQWSRLATLLEGLPADIVEANLELLLLKAWSLDNQLRRPEAWLLVDQAERLLSRSAADAAAQRQARGEIDALRSCQRLEEAQGDRAVEHAERSLAGLPSTSQSERGYSTITLALARQVCGRADLAFKVVYDAFREENGAGATFRARLMSSLAWIQWLEGDLRPIKIAAREYVDQGRASGLSQSVGGGLLFLGGVHYQLNELAEAEASLTPLVAERFLMATSQLFLQGGFALGLVLQATGRPDQACETADRIERGMLRVANAVFLPHARAFRAELALRQGRVGEAVRWAEQYDPEPFQLVYRFYAPEITKAKALVAEGSAESLRRAEQYLGRLAAFLSRTHNRIFLIPVLALEGLLLWRQGRQPESLERLGEAVALGKPGGALRVFADLDPEIGGLLNRLALDEEGLRYVGQILTAFRGDGTPVANGAERRALIDPLSGREAEILALLARRLSNQEIADRLHVSPGTVKRHTENIYQKLAVHGRREAVAKAVGLGILRKPL